MSPSNHNHDHDATPDDDESPVQSTDATSGAPPARWEWAEGEQPTHAELRPEGAGEAGQDSILYHGANWPMTEADKHLIQAAPVMKAALQEAAAEIHDCLVCGGGEVDNSPALVAITKAIAMAEGREVTAADIPASVRGLQQANAFAKVEDLVRALRLSHALLQRNPACAADPAVAEAGRALACYDGVAWPKVEAGPVEQVRPIDPDCAAMLKILEQTACDLAGGAVGAETALEIHRDITQVIDLVKGRGRG